VTPLSKYEDLNEEELIQLYQDNDDLDALEKMTILLLPKLYAFARKVVSDKNLVDEVVQEAWQKINNNAKSFHHDCKVQTWAYQIVKNTNFDLFRREKTRSHLSDDIAPLGDKADSSAEFAANSDTAITINSALLKIQKDQAEAIRLVSLEQYSYAEAAEKLGISIGTVKSRVNRGQIALAKILNELDPRTRNQKYV